MQTFCCLKINILSLFDSNANIAGTMGREVNDEVENDQATLYMVDEHNYFHPTIKVKPVTVSNGITWSSDNKYMFYIDTPTRNIDVFDFKLGSGTIRKNF